MPVLVLRVLTDAVREASDTRALVRVVRDRGLRGGVGAGGAVLARVALALVDVNVAVAGEILAIRVVHALHHRALGLVLSDEVILACICRVAGVLADTVGEARDARAPI